MSVKAFYLTLFWLKIEFVQTNEFRMFVIVVDACVRLMAFCGISKYNQFIIKFVLSHVKPYRNSYDRTTRW